MDKKNWETRWEKYILAYAKKVRESSQIKEGHVWIHGFLQTAILYTNLVLPPMATFITEFPVKIGSWDHASFQKKLNKSKRKDVERFVQLFLMDYLITFTDNPQNLASLNELYLFPFEFEQMVGNSLLFSKQEWDSFEKMKQKKDTYFPTILLLEHTYAEKEAKNEGLIEGVEVMKQTVYDQLDKALRNHTSTKKQ